MTGWPSYSALFLSAIIVRDACGAPIVPSRTDRYRAEAEYPAENGLRKLNADDLSNRGREHIPADETGSPEHAVTENSKLCCHVPDEAHEHMCCKAHGNDGGRNSADKEDRGVKALVKG